ncbi:unnamed protein product [Bathycoccus prasinos]
MTTTNATFKLRLLSFKLFCFLVVVFCCVFASLSSFSSAQTTTNGVPSAENLVVILNGNRRKDCAGIDARARRIRTALRENIKTSEERRRASVVTILFAADDRNDRCELLKRRVLVSEEEERKNEERRREREKTKKTKNTIQTTIQTTTGETMMISFEYATLPRREDENKPPIGGPRTRALSVRVSQWIRERRERSRRGGGEEEKEEEVYAFVEDDSEALMYFAAIAKETRGGATESLFDDVSFATITGVGFGGNNNSADAGADDDDVKEEDDNSSESSTRSEKMLDDMEAQWMRMESRKRAETIEVTSFERRLREIREKRRNSATEIRMAREMGSSFADESLVGVVMTHKNRPEYCEKAVEALLQQTHRKVEIVIVDDGSEEAHVKRLEQFVHSRKKDDTLKSVKIVKIAKPGKYLGEARNFGCSKLSEKTEYVLFSDDDNLAETNEIETMLRVLVHTKADVVTASNEFFVTAANGTNVVVGSYHPLGNALFPGIFENVFGDANALWRKSAFTSLEGFAKDTSYSLQDWEILAKASSSGLKLVTVPAPALYKYRTHAKSMSKQKEADASSSDPYEDIQFTGPLRGFAPLGEELVQLATFSKTMRKEYEAMEKTVRTLRKEDGGGGADAALGKVALKVLCKTLTYGSTTETEYVADGTFDAVPLSSQDNWHVHGEGGFKPVDGAILVPGNKEMLTEDAAGSTLVSGAWQRIEVNQLEAEPLVLSGWAKVIIDASKDDDVELLDTFEKSADFSLHADVEFSDGTKKWRPRAALFDDISLQPLNSRAVACDLAGVAEEDDTTSEKQTRRTRRRISKVEL